MDGSLSHATFRRETLRISIMRFFPVLFAISLGAANTIAWVVMGLRDPLVFLFVIPPAVAVLAVGAVLLLRRQFTVGMTPTDFRCCDFWGKYHQIPWESVRSATIWWLMGLPYLRIETGGRSRPLWMSLSLERRHELTDLLSSFVTADHPIRAALREFD